ncbi:MAG: hypothetical protein H6Q78_1655 [Candidatus Krumholzibacteriota bacterium]|nr:hypothetical protein [Candidatus Krumholzibacteriota bacterium]
MGKIGRVSVVLSVLLVLGSLGVTSVGANEKTKTSSWMKASVAKLESDLVSKYGEPQRERARRGLLQVAEFWREEDGGAADFEAFVTSGFAGDQGTLDEMFDRFEYLLEKLDGHMLEIALACRRQADLDIGPIMPFDEIFAGWDPSSHVLDDFFQNKLAFIVLLNFPLTTLDQRLTGGEKWTRREWAEVRLAQRFAKRIPADVNQAVAQANAASDQYISEYNIWMHHLLDDKGERLFPAKMRLLSHWNLRDELKAQYTNAEGGLARQRMIERVMERIVDQTIPEIVVDNPHVDWNPSTNAVTRAAVSDTDEPAPADMKISNAAEPDTRYRVLLDDFLAVKKVDPYSPTAPTHIARRFEEDREIPEARVKEMFEQILLSPLAPKVAVLIKERLGRPLEPFDIWYNGFRPKSKYTPAELDQIVRKKYPNAEAYDKDIPNLLVGLGFTPDRAKYLAGNIVVEPARGSGHAWGSGMREAPTRLRTRVGKDGMDYKGFNIAVHEMGHNVEQTLSLNDVDHTLLQGVPNTGFTEAIAFLFQSQDLRLLGLQSEDDKTEALKVLDDFWGTYEIAGVALLDMAIWHWMYDHPNATPSELKKATLQLAKDTWNKYYAPVIGEKDVVLLAVYSHIIHSFLYLPDYPLGHLIALQIEEQVKKGGSVGSEVERMAVVGNVTPDVWMKSATGEGVGAEAMLKAAEQALKTVSAKGK